MPVGTNEFQVLTFGDFGQDPTQVGEITYKAGSFYVMTSAGIRNLRDATAATRSNVQIFTSNGTWTKPANATMVSVVAIGGGGGGGSGATRNTATGRTGGQGGTGAGVVRNFYIPASFLAAAVSVIVGSGGIGGTARAGTNGANNDGVTGQAGGNSSFGNLVMAPGGNPGLGGTSAAGSQQNGPLSDYPGPGGQGAVMRSNNGTQTVTAVNISRFNPSGGGGGQGCSSLGTLTGGNAGASTNNALGTGILGGTFTSGAAGGNGNSAPVNSGWGGSGGGGGGARSITGGTAGGNGGLYGGGGGGGGLWNGGASGSSGAGGAGGAGIVIVIAW